MKRLIVILSLLAIFALPAAPLTKPAAAAEIKLTGTITKIEIAGKDAKTATATLKDDKSGTEVVITVNDEQTLDKFKDHRIVDGDEIRCKYEVINGKNVSTYFRKTAGC